MQLTVILIVSLALILFGAELFTNAVEWFGRKLNLGQGAVGSVLAALGTALPETAVPVTAILFGRGSASAHEVGIGGILGAPFLLATLGSLVVAISLLVVRRNHSTYQMNVGRRSFQRDMVFFLLAYTIAIGAGCLDIPWIHHLVPWVLVGLYVAFLVVAFCDKSVVEADTTLHPLYIQPKAGVPVLPLVVLQLLLALICIVGGAQLLTRGVEEISSWFSIPPFVLSAILVPLTTELPETLNSVVWIRQGKDGLALGNITGAMVFQSTLVPALGIWLTPWRLTPEALMTGCLTLAAAGYLFGMFRLRGALIPAIFMSASMLYWILPIQAVTALYHDVNVYWVGAGVVAVLFFASLKWGMKYRHF